MDTTVLTQLAIALGLGLLVGLQRERAQSPMAGIRTFALITWLGALAGLLTPQLGPWLVPAGLVALAALVVMSNVTKLRLGPPDPGLTTEVAALVMYLVGVNVVLGHRAVSVVVAGVLVLLLHWKQPLKSFVQRIGDRDVGAIMQFTLISLVILPVLPDRTFGPYDVLNPRNVWWMVVLIVGIGLGGYVAYKLAGRTAGTIVGGVLGGLVSSTATTAAYARRAAATPQTAHLCALVIAIASSVVVVRVGVEIAVVSPGLLSAAVAPLGILLLVSLLACGALWAASSGEAGELPEQSNPAELRTALFFAGLYAVVLLAVSAVKEHFGSAGLYGLAVVSGLTDVDAITLSTARLTVDGRLEADSAWRVILLAVSANLVFKTGIAFALGPAALRTRVGLWSAACVLAGIALLALWPTAA